MGRMKPGCCCCTQCAFNAGFSRHLFLLARALIGNVLGASGEMRSRARLAGVQHGPVSAVYAAGGFPPAPNQINRNKTKADAGCKERKKKATTKRLTPLIGTINI